MLVFKDFPFAPINWDLQIHATLEWNLHFPLTQMLLEKPTYLGLPPMLLYLLELAHCISQQTMPQICC